MRRYKVVIAAVTALLILSNAHVAYADQAPYNNYNYSHWGDAVHSPAAYLPSRMLSGQDLGVGDLKAPSDLYVSGDGRVYILDSGNNRIVVLDQNYRLIRTISSIDHDGKKDGFNKPQGIFVSDEGDIYVADTGNERVVQLDAQGLFVKQIDHPTANVLPDNYKFVPLKVGVDDAGRVYVISKGEYNGILEFNDRGQFDGFYGTINVKVNPISFYWKKFLSTKAQQAQMQLFLPTTFSNLDVDDQSFIYATNLDRGPTPIKRLNPGGKDVLKRNGYFNPVGDLVYNPMGEKPGPSQFADIKYAGNGMYTGLDRLRGRLFTYDEDGYLLYVFGGIGSKVGDFKTPVAVDKLGDDYLVLDQNYKTVTVFKPTIFGQEINQATIDQYNGDFSEATEHWKKVLSLDGNYDLAYIGIGKSLLKNEQYKEALDYLKVGYDRQYHSIAFKRYRREVMRRYFGAGMTTIAALIILFALFLWYRRFRKQRRLNKHAVDVS